MKLKKIVSLALAGVLAVSMLAGCSNNGSSSSNGTTQETTTSLVAMFQNAMKSYNPDLKITVKENSALATAIKSNSNTKDLTYADLIGASADTNIDKYTALAKTLYTSKEVATPSATSSASFTAVDSSTYDDVTTAMKVDTGATVDTVVCAADFLTGKVANGTEMNVVANTFAQAVKAAGIKNTYENVDSKDWTADYTVTLYSAEVSNINGESGTLLVMVVETNVEEVKD